jgi:hypothetical protein
LKLCSHNPIQPIVYVSDSNRKCVKEGRKREGRKREEEEEGRKREGSLIFVVICKSQQNRLEVIHFFFVCFHV